MRVGMRVEIWANMTAVSLSMGVAWVWGVPDRTRLQHSLVLMRAKEGVRQAARTGGGPSQA